MSSSTQKLVTVIVTTDNHTHAGRPVAKGKRLAVDEATAHWLINKGIATAAGAAASDQAETTASTGSKREAK